MENHFTLLDWLVLALYFAGTMSVGFICSRRSRSIEGFTAGSRSLPGWVCGLSIFATFLSSISFLALPGKAFGSNWNAFAFSLSLPLATIVAVKWFLPFYRKSGEVSAYAHLEHRFGPWARIYVGIFYLLTQIARIGTVTYLMALPLSILTGVPIVALILIVGVCVTIYASVGGLVAVIWTDAFQALILIAGAIMCIIVMLLGLPEGPMQVFDIAAKSDKFSPGSMDFSFATPTFWLVLLNGVFINLQNFGIDQSYVQRYVASSSDREARKSLWLGGLLYVPISALLLFIGTSLFAWYETHPDDKALLQQAIVKQKLDEKQITPADPLYADKIVSTQKSLIDADLGDKAFPHFIGHRLPAGITGLIIAAVLAAGMSTVSTSLNSSATLILSDWYKRYINPQASERQSMLVLYGGTIAWGIMGTGVAILMINIQSALDAWWTLSSIFSGGIVGLFLLGLISKRAGNPAAVTAVILGALVILWMTISTTDQWPAEWESLRSPFHKFLIVVIGSLTILITGLGISRLTTPSKHESKQKESV